MIIILTSGIIIGLVKIFSPLNYEFQNPSDCFEIKPETTCLKSGK